MIIGKRLIKSTEQLLLNNGLHCLEIGWLKENRPDVLQAIHSERISLENLAQHFGITSMWHAHFRAKILREWKELVDAHGLVALTHRWLQDRKMTRIFTSLRRLGMTMADGVKTMGYFDEFMQFKGPSSGKYLWTAEKFEEITRQVIKEFGCFPPGEFLDKNGYGGLRSNIGRFGPTSSDIRKRYNVQNVVLQSLDQQIWLSLPEVNFANYLLARGIKVMKGRSYPVLYSETYNRKRGFYDMHFVGTVEPFENKELSVEIFGTGNYGGVNIRKKHYAETRRFKEDFHKNDETFIAIEYKDCYSDVKLGSILGPYIGYPDVNICGRGKFNTTMISIEESVLQQCRDIKDRLGTDKLPSSAWFDRTGPYKNRKVEEWEPKSFAKLVQNIERLKFTEVRRLLGESNIRSNKTWNEAEVISQYKDTMVTYNVSPAALYSRLRLRLKRENSLSRSDMLLMSQMSKLSNAISKFFKGRQHVLNESR